MRAFFPCVVILVIALVSVVGVEPVVEPVVAVEPLSTSVGFSDNGQLLNASDADLSNTLTIMNQSGVHALRMSIPWIIAEPAQGQFDWSKIDRVVNAAAAKNMSILAILASTPAWATSPPGGSFVNPPGNPATFASFTAAAATRYKGKISAYEIWNEPNGSIFYNPVSASGYTQLLQAAYPAIKGADSSATVVGGVLGATESGNGNQDGPSFLAQMYQAGAHGSFDALSYHPYQYTLTFDSGVQVPNSPMLQLIDLHAQMVANGDGAKKIWATEYGEPTATVSEDQQNTMISTFMIKWQELPYAGPMFLFMFRDTQTGSTDPEATFGFVHTDYTAKPSIMAMSYLIAHNIPKSAEYARFSAANITGIGNPISVVSHYGDIFIQERDSGWVYETPKGFFTSPSAVANAIAPTAFYPIGAFVNGMQDFNSPSGMRVYSSPSTGTHLIGGGITAVWQPSNGLAITDEMPMAGGGVRVNFQSGYITWTPQTGGVRG